MSMYKLTFTTLIIASLWLFGLNSSVAQVRNETSIIIPDNHSADELFGWAVKQDGIHLAVSSSEENLDENEQNSVLKAGAVSVFEKQSNGEYKFAQKIVSSNREIRGRFGYALDISGNSMIVGTEEQQVVNGDTIKKAGSVYFFNKFGGQWVERSRFQTPDNDSLDNEFAREVAIDGDFAVVSCYRNSYDENGQNYKQGSGAVFVYKRGASNNWTLFQKLVASDRSLVGGFGESLDIDGNWIVVGCPDNAYDDKGNIIGSGMGAVYVFKLEGSTWVQKQKVLAINSGQNQDFSSTVDLNNDILIIGHRGNDKDENEQNTIQSAGAVQVYEKSNDKFTFKQKLVASDRAYNNRFGEGLTLKGDIAVISSPPFNFPNGLWGKSYLFERQSDGTWSETAILEPKNRNDFHGYFGLHNGIAIENGSIYVSAIQYEVNGVMGGAVLEFDGPVISSVYSTSKYNLKWTIYPNPAINSLFVKSPELNGRHVNYRILNSSGQIVLSGALLSGTSEINVSSLSRGMYVILFPDISNFSKKFIK